MPNSANRRAPCRAWMWHFLIQMPGRSPEVTGVLITHTQVCMNRCRTIREIFGTENNDVGYNLLNHIGEGNPDYVE